VTEQPPGCPMNLGCGPAGPMCRDYLDCAEEAGVEPEPSPLTQERLHRYGGKYHGC
jgi:hypothetical protein